MQSGEMFRKLNNFTDVPLVCDDGSVTKGLVLHFFINILFLFSELSTQRKTRENKENGQFVKRRKLCGWQAARRSVKVEA